MTRKKTFPHELIGEEMEIVSSTNSSYLGVCGKIIDETKETIKVRKEDGKEIVLLKNAITFKLSNTGEIISGKEITKRPEERLKG